VAEVPGIRRVRFTTSHPNDFTREIVEAVDAVPRSAIISISRAIGLHAHPPRHAPHLHARRISRKNLLDSRRAPPHQLTSDIIVGFPGETEADFDDTLTLLDAAAYDGVFAFKYSPRPNTSAATMPGAVPEEEKTRRLAILQERQRLIQTGRNEKLIGETLEILVDARHAARDQWAGRSTSNRVLNFTSPHQSLLGQYVQVRVTARGSEQSRRRAGCPRVTITGGHDGTRG
jgi:tRNA-2-methylthio-N6-dimethylallyladenosine synthase